MHTVIRQKLIPVASGGSASLGYTPPSDHGLNVIKGVILKYDQDVRVTITEDGTEFPIFQADSKQMQSPFFPVNFRYSSASSYTIAVAELAAGGDITAVVAFQLSSEPRR